MPHDAEPHAPDRSSTAGLPGNEGSSGAEGSALARPGVRPETNLFSSAFVEASFDKLRDNAIQDITRYVSGWSIYSVHFLNAVAIMQDVEARLDNETLLALRRGAKRAAAPDLVPLLREARDPRSMQIERIIGLIRAEAGQD